MEAKSEEELAKLGFTRDGFYAWLQGKQDGEEVGQCGDALRCILAQFGADTIHVPGGRSVGVYHSQLRVYSMAGLKPGEDLTEEWTGKLGELSTAAVAVFDLPAWAEDIMFWFDDLEDIDEVQDQVADFSHVTAGEVRKLGIEQLDPGYVPISMRGHDD